MLRAIVSICLALVVVGDCIAGDICEANVSAMAVSFLQLGSVQSSKVAVKENVFFQVGVKHQEQEQELEQARAEPADLDRSQAPCLHVLAFDRPDSLGRLLTQLNKVDYGSDSGHVRLTISIDYPRAGASADVFEQRGRTVAVAKDFKFAHGEVLVQARAEHAGIVPQWVDSWQPDLDTSDTRAACVILEDDVVPSRQAWLWTKNALAAYGDQLERIATFAWQRPRLVPATSSTRGLGQMPPVDVGTPFLYKLMSSWGLVALRSHWIGFRKWMKQNYVEGHPADILFEGQAIQPSVWHQSGPSHMWTYWLIRYMDEKRLFTLYGNMQNSTTLCANMREPGLHYHEKNGQGADFPILDADVPALRSFPTLQSLTWYDWDAKPVTPEAANLGQQQAQVAIRRHDAHKALALCTMTTVFTKDVKRLFHSIETYMPNVTVYVETTQQTGHAIKEAFPELSFVMSYRLSRYAGLDRQAMTSADLWTPLQMEKAAVMRTALQDGFEGAWYVDADSFLLAPLPQMPKQPMALSPHLANHHQTTTYGTFNGGNIFVRDTHILDDWESIAPVSKTDCCQDQTALDTLSTMHQYSNMSCGINVGWWQMRHTHNPEKRDMFDKVRCDNGRLMFKECEVVSMHFHSAEPKLKGLKPYLMDALAKCKSPMEEWAM